MKKVYFDTNILLDIALKRQPFINDALALITLIENNKIIGYVNGVTIVNIHYIMSKSKGKETALKFVSDLMRFFRVATIDNIVIDQAINSGFSDFEDAVQEFSASNSKVEIIVTRNTKDFKNSRLQVFEPKQFIEWFDN